MYVESKLEKFFGVSHLFLKMDGTSIELLFAKVTYNLLVAGKRAKIESFMNELRNAFDVVNV